MWPFERKNGATASGDPAGQHERKPAAAAHVATHRPPRRRRPIGRTSRTTSSAANADVEPEVGTRPSARTCRGAALRPRRRARRAPRRRASRCRRSPRRRARRAAPTRSMLGSTPLLRGAARTPATAPTAVATPQPNIASQSDVQAERRATAPASIADARRPSPSFVRRDERAGRGPRRPARDPPSRARDLGNGEAGEMDGARRERLDERPRRRAPDPRVETVDGEQQPDRQQSRSRRRPAAGRPHEHALEREARRERERDRHAEGGPEAPAVADERAGDERRERRQRGLREVDHAASRGGRARSRAPAARRSHLRPARWRPAARPRSRRRVQLASDVASAAVGCRQLGRGTVEHDAPAVEDERVRRPTRAPSPCRCAATTIAVPRSCNSRSAAKSSSPDGARHSGRRLVAQEQPRFRHHRASRARAGAARRARACRRRACRRS